MTDSVHVTIPGPPVPWKRPTNKQGARGRSTPPELRQYKRHVKACAQSAIMAQCRGARWGTHGRYDVELYMFFPDLRARDDDNVEKAIKDACQTVLWHADSWTYFRRVVKVMELDRQNPRVELVVTRV